MTFSDKSFSERLKVLGDTTEQRFEEYCKRESVPLYRTGFVRPPFSFSAFKRIPKVIRHFPDYVVEFDKIPFFVECKAFGRYPLKVKEETVDSLLFWEQYLPTILFVYDQQEDSDYFIVGTSLFSYINEIPKEDMKQFSNDKKFYYEVTRKTLLELKETVW